MGVSSKEFGNLRKEFANMKKRLGELEQVLYKMVQAYGGLCNAIKTATAQSNPDPSSPAPVQVQPEGTGTNESDTGLRESGLLPDQSNGTDTISKGNTEPGLTGAILEAIHTAPSLSPSGADTK